MLPRHLLLLCFVALPATSFASSGGPDGYGYTWADQDSSPYPFYNWLTPASTNTISYTTLGDENTSAVSIPFAFTFYGTNYSTAYVNANGVLSFSNTAFSYSNDCVTGYNVPSILAFADDMNFQSGASVTYGTAGSSPNRVFLVSFNSVQHYSATGNVTFQIQLHESDDHIEIHYLDTYFASAAAQNYGGTAGVGIRNASSYTLSSWCNQAYLSDYGVIAFYPPGATCGDFDFDGYEDDSCGGTDCDDSQWSVYPGATESCDGLDNDCDGFVDDGSSNDFDGDGWSWCNGDCDDSNFGVNPSTAETCDFSDNDCDGSTDEGFDADGDGWTTCDGDCSDSNPNRNPGETEVPNNGVDEDCDASNDTSGDDDTSTGDDDTSTGDDDTSTGDDDTSTGDDDTSTGDDDTSTGDDDTSTGDDDSAVAGDDDDASGGRGGGRSSGRGCSNAGGASPSMAIGLFALALGARRRR